MAEFIQKVKENPLQAITVSIAVIGVVFSIFNFYLLANISPLEKRVVAIEKRNETVDPLVTRFIQLEERDIALINNVEDIKQDIRDIKNFLNIR